MIKPINAESLKGVFVRQFEENILSGYFHVGEKLPSERDLAAKMGVSRPVVHEGLIDLAAKGLVTMKPRFGTIVNDYRKEGSLALLQSLFQYKSGAIDDAFLTSLLDMRLLFEIETVRLAAINRTDDQLAALLHVVENEKKADRKNLKKVTELDFNFHHSISLATGNVIYPLLLNSMKLFYTNVSGLFFNAKDVVSVVFDYHEAIADAVKDKAEKKATTIMKEMLSHGEVYLRQQIGT